MHLERDGMNHSTHHLHSTLKDDGGTVVVLTLAHDREGRKRAFIVEIIRRERLVSGIQSTPNAKVFSLIVEAAHFCGTSLALLHDEACREIGVLECCVMARTYSLRRDTEQINLCCSITGWPQSQPKAASNPEMSPKCLRHNEVIVEMSPKELSVLEIKSTSPRDKRNKSLLEGKKKIKEREEINKNNTRKPRTKIIVARNTRQSSQSRT